MSDINESAGREAAPRHVIASAHYLRYEDDRGWLKAVHARNPRFSELDECVKAAGGSPDSYPSDTADRDWRPELISFDDALDGDFTSRGYSVAVFCGGLNGGGDGFKWLRYLDDIRAVLERVISVYGKCWVVDISVHSDVYYVTVGIEDMRGYEVGQEHPRTMHEEMADWDAYVEGVLSVGRPVGIIDWGDRDFDWAWAKVSRPYGWPLEAFSGSLFHYMGCYNDLRVFEKPGGPGDSESVFFKARSVKQIDDGRMLFFVKESDDDADEDEDLRMDEEIASGRRPVVPVESAAAATVTATAPDAVTGE